jgi:5'-nucleotidase
MCRAHRLAAVLLASLLIIAGCSDDSGSSDEGAAPDATVTTSTSTSTTTAPESQTLTIVVTNDDGIGADGIDTMVTALETLPDVEIHVVAPAKNQSGTSDKTTPGGATSAPGTTKSGVAGIAVDGFPADTIAVALDKEGLKPDLVVSGINEGQNAGPIGEVSGTVGAARAAIRRGVPALALSAGIAAPFNYDIAARYGLDWIEQHRGALLDGSISTDSLASINVPLCTAGEPKDLIEVAVATNVPEGEGAKVFATDCTVDGPAPVDDITGLIAGHSTLSQVPANG